MNIRIQCECGSRFSFDVEPVDGRMPVIIACPTCGKDATAAANVEIAGALGGTEPAPQPASPKTARIRVAMPAPTAPTPATAESAPAPAAPACFRHPLERAVEQCRVCGKPICLKCMESYGYVCSHQCRETAELRNLSVPVYANQTGYKLQRARTILHRSIAATVALVLLLAGAWVYYVAVARAPKAVFVVTAPIPAGSMNAALSESFHLAGPDRLLRIGAKRLSLLNITANTQSWSVDYRDASGNSNSAPDEDGYFAEPEVVMTSSDAWLWDFHRLTRVDLKTGAVSAPLNGQTLGVFTGENSIAAVSRAADGKTTLTRIALPGGQADSEEIQYGDAGPALPDAARAALTRPGLARGTATRNSAAQNRSASPALSSAGFEQRELIPSGATVADFRSRLIEEKSIERQAMRPKGPAVLDNPNVNASQGLAVYQEMANESQRARTGGVERENVSRYAVSVLRHFGGGASEWSAEMQGVPAFASLKTVDLVTAGHTIVALDRENKKLWEATMTYPLSTQSSAKPGRAPCLEAYRSVFVADEGMLACLDAATGAPRWRLNSVGIRQILDDGKGALYVATTTASIEDLRYKQDVNVKKRIDPVIVKVDAATGKLLWPRSCDGNEILRAGRFIYASFPTEGYELMNLEEGAKDRYSLKLLNQEHGTWYWNYQQNNRAFRRVEAAENWILLQFVDKAVVLKFFSF